MDQDPEFWPNLDQDPRVMLSILKKTNVKNSFGGNKFSSLKISFKKLFFKIYLYKKIMAPKEMFSQLSL